MKIERFEDIEAWRLARELTRKVYSLTKKPEFAKDYGLKRQIQEASGSSMHNIAEGFDSETNAEFIRFLYDTLSSLAQKFRANSMSPWMKSTYLSTNSKKSMGKREEPVLPYVDLSTISRNMKKGKQPTVNREPDNLSSYRKAIIYLLGITILIGCVKTQEVKIPKLVFKPPPREKMEDLLSPMISDDKDVEQYLTFSLREADIREALLSLSKTIGYNIVLDPEVTGKATVDVKRLTPAEALDAILTPLKFQYKKENNYIRISKLTPETRVFQLNYINTKRSGSSSLTTFLNVSGGGGGGGGGSISSTDTADVWAEIETGLKDLLSETGKITINKMSGIIVATDLPLNLKKVGRYLEQIEGSVQRQVMIQAKIVSVDLSNEFQMGLDWSAITKISGIGGSLGGNKILSQSLAPTTGIFQMGLTDGDFSMVLRAMSSQGKVNIVSSPRISALNNQKAAIKVVRSDVFFEVRTDIAPTTGVTTTSTSSKIVDVGVVLEVTPQISGDREIVMNIHPIITEKVDTATFDSDKIKLSVPVLTSREANTVVKIKDGQTMVIAGLIQDKADVKKKKVPFLGDIPYVGSLFRQTVRSGQKNELVIFLTPTILIGKNIEDLTQEEIKNLNLEI